LPLFLPNLPWATEAYVDAKSSRFVTSSTKEQVAKELLRFYKTAHRLAETTFPLLSWNDVAKKYRAVYEKIISQK
jgi:hypothetical protein